MFNNKLAQRLEKKKKEIKQNNQKEIQINKKRGKKSGPETTKNRNKKQLLCNKRNAKYKEMKYFLYFNDLFFNCLCTANSIYKLCCM